MRQEIINRWIRELEKEIQKAKDEVNYAKLLDLKKLKLELIKIRDGTS